MRIGMNMRLIFLVLLLITKTAFGSEENENWVENKMSEALTFKSSAGVEKTILSCDYDNNYCQFDENITLIPPSKNDGFTPWEFRIDKGTKIIIEAEGSGK